MKPEDLKGRELAAWFRGRASACEVLGQPIFADTANLAAAEIERLCANDNKVFVAPVVGLDAWSKAAQEQAARDAAALDEIATVCTKHLEDPQNCYWLLTALQPILERAGRKVRKK